jgi:uncharacterized membrane protein YjjP (DUF1212 family)
MSYALISGLVSGLAYWFNPSLTILASAVAVLLKVIIKSIYVPGLNLEVLEKILLPLKF